ncbi:MAG: YceH family protein [Pseudomonadota bacterium]|nr:YceH family protein [Pseudomonadota bacterium]
MAELILSAHEARVVAVMVEKSITTPQYYPMTVNAIMMATNQKTSRHPVMNLTEGDVGAALNRLDELKLVTRDSFSGRVQKWRQQFMHQLMLKPQTMALLTTLILRSSQTAAELRANALPLGGPGDADAFSAALADLADRATPLVVQLPRAHGQAATRYGHTVCGAQDSVAFETPSATGSVSGGERVDLPALLARVQALEARVGELESQLGISPATPAD